MKQLGRSERSRYGRENADAYWPTDSALDGDADGARDAGALDAPGDDRASRGSARPSDPEVCRRQDEYRGGARAAVDEANRRQVAHAVSAPPSRRAAR